MKKEINDEVKKHKKGKAKGIFKWIGFFLVFQIIYVPILSIALIYYGPFTNTRDMIVTTAMTTMKHQYFATWFLSKEKIDEILAKQAGGFIDIKTLYEAILKKTGGLTPQQYANEKC